MTRGRKITIAVVSGMGGVAVAAALYSAVYRPRGIETLRGALVQYDDDFKEQTPIANAEISIGDGLVFAKSRSDGSGFFSLNLKPPLPDGQTIQLRARREGFEPLDLTTTASDRLYVLRMNPTAPGKTPAAARPDTEISEIRVRYAVKTTSTMNVGGAVKPFEIVNVANQPCRGRHPCSPDGRWKANIGSASLDAGELNEFRNARVSCIAGPCPFSQILSDGFSRGGRRISVSVLNWSDTVTYLLEAEVTRTMAGDAIHYSYPVIFGRSLTFTLPANAQGPSIEADLNGAAIIFPLGPNLRLSWADCSFKVGNDRTQVFSCELKQGYRFHAGAMTPH
jgi:hypothetical protein